MEHFIDAFPTLFLPIAVPTCPLSEAVDKKDEGQSVLQCWYEFQKSQALGSEYSKLLGIIKRFVALHSRNIGVAAILKSLGQTPTRDYWSFWLREQNAAVLVYREDVDSALVFVWELQCPNDAVTGVVSAYCQTLPRSGVRVPWTRLLHSTELLHDLAFSSLERALPKSRKAGKEFHEKRDVKNPLYALEFLLSALGGEALVVGETDLGPLGCITKKLRDEVRYESSELPWRRHPIWSAIRSTTHLVCVRETGSDCVYKMLVQNFLAFVLQSLSTATTDVSILKEASIKLVRRLAKLRNNVVLIKKDAKILSTCETVTKLAVCSAMKIVNSVWDQQCSIPVVSKNSLSLKDIRAQTVHTLKESKCTLQQLVLASEEKSGDISERAFNPNSTTGPPETFDRLRHWSALLAEDVHRQTELLGLL